MSIASTIAAVRRSFSASTGTIVFGMEDGTVSIFGLVFGVAATTSISSTIIIAGASGAAAAAVSMMAGAYLETETSKDTNSIKPAAEPDDTSDALALRTSLSERMTAAGVSDNCTKQLVSIVARHPEDCLKLITFLQTPSRQMKDPREQALWMLLADFFSAAIPILPFALLPVAIARVISSLVTLVLLVLLGLGRASIGRKSVPRTVIETVTIGIAAALAGVAIGLLLNFLYK